MANDCLNRVTIEAPIERLEELVRGPALLTEAWEARSKAPAIPAMLAALDETGDRQFLRVQLSRTALTLRFESRWEPPTEVVAAFAAGQPDAVVEHLYAEPLNGLFGRIRYENGAPSYQQVYDDEDEADLMFRGKGWDVECDFRLNSVMMRGALLCSMPALWEAQ